MVDEFHLFMEKHAPGADWDIKLSFGRDSMWAGTVRLTRHPNAPDHRPDRSIVFFSAAGSEPEEVLFRALAGARAEVESW